MFVRTLGCSLLGIAVAGCGETVGEAAEGSTAASSTEAGVTSAGGAVSAASSASAGAASGDRGGSGNDVTGVGGEGAGAAGSGGAMIAAGGTMGGSGSGSGGMGEAGEGGVAGSGGGLELPGFDDLVIRSTAMGEYEGLTVFVAYDHNITVDSRSDNRSDVVSSAAFEVVWRQGFDRNTFGAYVLLYVDLDGDAVCTDALDVAWWFFANNPGGAGEPVVADFDPTAEGQLPGLQGITCQMFEDGL